MSQFRVGQRVRIVKWTPCEAYIEGITEYFGSEAYWLTPAGWPRGIYLRHELRPLTDPRADAFIESIKRIEREPNNVVVKERA